MRWYHLTAGIFTILLALQAGVLAYGAWHAPATEEEKVSTVDGVDVAAITAACADARPKKLCYQRQVTQRLDQLSVSESFEVIRALRAADEEYRYCHVLAHRIGEREVAKDPSQWMQVIPKNPTDGLCSNGFMHGALVERFSAQELSEEALTRLEDDLRRACEPRNGWNPTPLDTAICYHGLGHLLVHATDGAVQRALASCRAVSDESGMRTLCREGVYMQLFQPLEPEDHALVDALALQPKRENLEQFCRRYAETTAAREACWREGWALVRRSTTTNITGERVARFCSGRATDRFTDRCFDTVLYQTGRGMLGRPAAMRALCEGLPQRRQQQCYTNFAMTHVEENKRQPIAAAQFCSEAPRSAVRRACAGELVARAEFVYGESAERMRSQLCAAVRDAGIAAPDACRTGGS